MPVKTPKDRLLKLRELIHLFHDNIQQYKTSSYDEANTRVDFIDKFFELLEWDVRNTKGYSEAYREVVREDKVVIAGKPKAPDYSFRIGGRKFFFVEAKKPCVNIKEERDPAFQLRRYGYTAKLPLSILTDFEEFAVYDTRIKPSITDKASTARIFYCEFIELLKQNKIDPEITNFEYIYSIFSKDAILKGSFDRYIEETKKKKGTSEVDKEILKLIDDWRCELAKNIALRNTELDVYNLNYAVQKIIDRIIFLRIAEDRNTEEYGKLKSLLETKEIYKQLVQVFNEANKKYNSGLFAPQEYIDTLQIDNNILTRIIKSFYYPACPYELSILPIEILGNAYEQFLGKKIRLTTAHQAKIEEKPEVRKAGGVYYTPQYIVDYIVQNTVGEKVKRKKPEDIEHLRIVDPACGSGSFLVRTYDFLLKHYIKYYCQKSKLQTALKKGKIYQVDETTYYLSIDEKQKILLNNIYGVDIDEQAVEVTKLSLLLKLMENEGEEYKNFLFQHHDLTLLPDLSDNIKCGNSLIGSDFYNDKDLGLFDKEEMRKVNVFDWKKEFPEVFENGGFDCVIGNPPYIRIQIMKETFPANVNYFNLKYSSACKGNYDIYVLFTEKGLKVLNNKGFLGFILPHKFMNSKYGESLREIISNSKYLNKVIHFGDNQIFDGATTYTCLLFLNKQGSDNINFTQVDDINEWLKGINKNKDIIPADRIDKFEWFFIIGDNFKIISKMNSIKNKLGNITHLFVGLQTDADDVYILEEVRKESDYVFCLSKATGEVYKFEDNHLKNLIKGSLNIRRYYLSNLTKRLIFPYRTLNNKSLLITPEEYKKEFPLTWDYLNLNKFRLKSRNKGNINSSEWYGYVYKKNHIRLDNSKLLIPSIANKVCVAPDIEGNYFFVGSGGGGGGGYGISILSDCNFSYIYLLGLMNSKLINYYIKNNSTTFRGGYIALNRQYIERVPIILPDILVANKKLKYNTLCNLVTQMLDTQKQYHSVKSNADKTIHKKKIDLLEKQIDNLVYELYDLTAEEIKIVENS